MKETRELALLVEAQDMLIKYERFDGNIADEVIRVVETAVRFLAASGFEAVKFNLRYVYDSIKNDHDDEKDGIEPEKEWPLVAGEFLEWMARNGFDPEGEDFFDGVEATLRWGSDKEIVDATSRGAADMIFFPNSVFDRNGWTLLEV